MEKNSKNIIKSKENFAEGAKLQESQDLVLNDADVVFSGDQGQNKQDSSIRASEDENVERSDMVPDSPVNNAKMRDGNGAF